METRTIVAIEIASSKIKGGVAAVGPDGRISVLAVEEIPGINNVRYGRIQNIREVSLMVNEIIGRLEKNPSLSGRKVKAMTLSLGGRSCSAQPATASIKFPKECEITDTHVQRLGYEAARDFMGDKNIEAMVPRMFYVNNAAVRKAVGTFGDNLRGDFMMITCGRETRQNLDRLMFETVTRENIAYILRPTAVADLVLTSDERELGCVLVDFGAETTTVSVYKDGTLAFLCTIPMGSRLITLDLTSGMGVTEEAAENYKLTLGTMADSAGTPRSANVEEVNGYVRARAGEIAANILNQIELSGYPASELSQVVLVGGGSKLPEFAVQLGAQCKLPVRLAEMPVDITFRTPGRNNADNIDIVALLLATARTTHLNCLTSVKVPDFAESPVITLDNVAQPESVPEPEEETAVPAEAPAHRDTIARAGQAMRRPLDEDDERLLKDDEDEEPAEEEEENEKPKARRRGIFSRFSRRKDKDDEYEEYDEDEDSYEDEEEDYPEDEGDDDNPDADESDFNDPDHYQRTRNVMNALRDRFVSIFSSGNDDN
ncbi:MAG: pilus assembly protein PilM [Muribaculaceae bacterium]|nr:pilus assembly protein PilM [Muribaculaceae bacterium]